MTSIYRFQRLNDFYTLGKCSDKKQTSKSNEWLNTNIRVNYMELIEKKKNSPKIRRNKENKRDENCVIIFLFRDITHCHALFEVAKAGNEWLDEKNKIRVRFNFWLQGVVLIPFVSVGIGIQSIKNKLISFFFYFFCFSFYWMINIVSLPIFHIYK